MNISGEYDYLVIYNVSGNEVQHYTYTQQISVSELPEGIYFIKIVSGQRSETFKLVVSSSK